MRFDPATSSFLALLEIKSKKNLKSAKFKSQVFGFRSAKTIQTHFLSLQFCHLTHLQVLKNFVGQ